MTQSIPATLMQSAVWDRLDGMPFAVLGLGKSGVAAANALARRGADVTVWDDASADKLEHRLSALVAGVSARCGEPYIARPGEIAVISPGIGPTTAAWKRVHTSAYGVIGEIELFYRLDRSTNDGAGHPILAITGTDGKTTTASMLAEVLRSAGHRVALAGNIGDPLCGLVDQLDADAVVVAEISAFQVITAPKFRARVAVLTNIAEDHVDYFGGNFQAYAEAKLKLAQACGAGDTVVYNAADPRLKAYAETSSQSCRFWPFSARELLKEGATVDQGALRWVGPHIDVNFARLDELGADSQRPWGGTHNQDNALAVCAAALAFGVKPDDIRAGLRRFATPPHRCEPAGRIGDVRFINDSKATNPHAALAGVKGTELQGEECLVWIGGGSDKQSNFVDLAQEVGRRARTAIVCGATAPQLITAFGEVQAACEVLQTPDLHSAVALAWQHAQPHGCVLFSPACASFDSFQSYAHRGEVFKQAVERLTVAVTPSEPNLSDDGD